MKKKKSRKNFFAVYTETVNIKYRNIWIIRAEKRPRVGSYFPQHDKFADAKVVRTELIKWFKGRVCLETWIPAYKPN